MKRMLITISKDNIIITEYIRLGHNAKEAKREASLMYPSKKGYKVKIQKIT